jgi:hypothetical protein
MGVPHQNETELTKGNSDDRHPFKSHEKNNQRGNKT